jgi:polysaccharide pyruvyl transferase WcaK-like protein
MIDPPEIVLVTRVRTNNKGNQALSAGWVTLAKIAFPGAAIRVFERRPAHLTQFSLQQFAQASDPFAAFDAVTSKLATLAPGPDSIAAAGSTSTIQLDENITPKPTFAWLRQRLGLRAVAAKAGAFRAAYVQRLAAFQRARLVIVNPAGEFFPNDPIPALYHLLDVHVANKLGCRTAIVNHTLDVKDPTLRAIIPQVYRSLSLVGFRDEKSVPAFIDMGGDMRNVVVAPDVALTTPPPASSARRAGKVAVAIHVPHAEIQGTLDQWIEAIAKLRSAGLDPILVSNEFPSDNAYFARVVSQLQIKVEGQGLDFDQYAALLGTFDFVVSSRMHTNILSMVACTPVVPVEGPSFKISGLFQELGIPTSVIQSSEAGWTDKVTASAVAMKSNRDAMESLVTKQMAMTRQRITDTLVPRLRNAAIWT